MCIRDSYQSFFAKHFSNCGASNTLVGVMYVLSVGMKLPFLFFSARLYKKLTVWQWLMPVSYTHL